MDKDVGAAAGATASEQISAEWPLGRTVAEGKVIPASIAAQQAQYATQQAQSERTLDSDLSALVLGEASRQVGLAERELRRCERVYEAVKKGDLSAITVRDLRLLLPPRL